jgi:hypothetical protein
LLHERLTRPRAETIALDGLAFLAGRPDDIARFLKNSGLDAAELRLRAGEPEVLRAVLDFLLTDDGLVTEFCGEARLEPRDLHLANHVLSQP